MDSLKQIDTIRGGNIVPEGLILLRRQELKDELLEKLKRTESRLLAAEKKLDHLRHYFRKFPYCKVADSFLYTYLFSELYELIQELNPTQVIISRNPIYHVPQTFANMLSKS